MNVDTSMLNLDHHVGPTSIVRFLKGFIQKTIFIFRVKTGINMQRYVSDVNTSNKHLIKIESLNKDAFTLTYLDTAQRLAYFI